MRDFLDGIPAWTDHGKEGRLDPLAMLRPVEALSCNRSSTFLSESGKWRYIITARRMISALVLK